MKKRINETLAELMAGILLAGVLIQAVEFVVVAVCPEWAGSPLSFALGLWIGIFTALGLSVHMYRAIDRALDMASGDAESYMRKAYLLRTVAIFAMAALVHFLKIGYVMAAFLGVLCLKFGAFLQPLMHKLWKKFHR